MSTSGRWHKEDQGKHSSELLWITICNDILEMHAPREIQFIGFVNDLAIVIMVRD